MKMRYFYLLGEMRNKSNDYAYRGQSPILTTYRPNLPTVFPQKGKRRVITGRRLNRKDHIFPETMTAKVNCCGKRHSITITDNGEVLLHAHKSAAELEAMRFFGDEKCRCLQVLDCWNGIYNPDETWRDTAELKALLPRQFHALATQLERARVYQTQKVYRCGSISFARQRVRQENERAILRTSFENKAGEKLKGLFAGLYTAENKPQIRNAAHEFWNLHSHTNPESYFNSLWRTRVRSLFKGNVRCIEGKTGIEYFIVDTFTVGEVDGNKMITGIFIGPNGKTTWGLAIQNGKSWNFTIDPKTGEIK